jgi:polysaccharide pyruvyl transferase WcaK-like protein
MEVGRSGLPARVRRSYVKNPTASSAPRVGLIGHFGIGNLGNDASLTAVADGLVRALPGTTIVPICHRPNSLPAQLAANAVPIHVPRPRNGRERLVRARSRLRDVQHARKVVRTLDGLIVPGTGILDDYGGERGLGFPATLLQWVTLARHYGVPTALLSVGAGPFRDRIGRVLISRLVDRVDYRSFRDASSAAFVRSLGPPVGPDDVVPDVVLGLPPAEASPTERPVLVMAVMQYSGWYRGGLSERHEIALADVAQRTLGTGMEVRLLTADANDRAATERVLARIRAATPESLHAQVSHVEAADLGQVVEVMASARAAVVTRYHSLVGALVAGRPVVSIGYGDKNDDLMRSVGLHDYCQHIDTVDTRLLHEQTAQALEEADRLAPEIGAAVSAFRARIEVQQERVVGLIEGRRQG